MHSRFVILAICFTCCITCASTSSAQKLSELLSNKDTAAAAALLASGKASIYETDAFGNWVMSSACRYGEDTMVLKFLLDHGAKPDSVRSPKGRTCLMVAAAYYGGVPMCRQLIKHGADVNAMALDGTTALMLAAQNLKSDLVAYLIEHGANPRQKDSKGRNALAYANAAKVEDYMLKSMPGSKIDKDATIAILSKYE